MTNNSNPIQVGDFLEVTQEYLDYLQSQRMYGSQVHLGTWLKAFHIDSQIIRAHQGETWQYPVPYSMALRMRNKADANNPANVARRVIQLEGENASFSTEKVSLVIRIQEYVTRLYGDIGNVTPSGAYIVLSKNGIAKLLKQRFEEIVCGWWFHSVAHVNDDYVLYLTSKHPGRMDPVPSISIPSTASHHLDELEFIIKHLVARAIFQADHGSDEPNNSDEKLINDTSLLNKPKDPKDDDPNHIEDENIY